MENSTRLQRKNILIRGLQMLLFGFFINLGLTVISFPVSYTHLRAHET